MLRRNVTVIDMFDYAFIRKAFNFLTTVNTLIVKENFPFLC